LGRKHAPLTLVVEGAVILADNAAFAVLADEIGIGRTLGGDVKPAEE
jgi:hypothetical protein